jgi:hypothetical protein
MPDRIPSSYAHAVRSPVIARVLRWTGYGLSFAFGMALWPRLMEWGFHYRNTQFGLALLFNWFCLPVSMSITYAVSWLFMHVSKLFDSSCNGATLSKHISTASMIGVVATLGSCGLIASGYEPPAPFYSIYDLDLH